MTLTVAFDDVLRPLLAPARRRAALELAPVPTETIKHAIEALGVPHTEVREVRVDGCAAPLDARLPAGGRIEVRGWTGAGDASPPTGPGTAPRFLADAHLGALARRLRLLGFDTLVGDSEPDHLLAALSDAQRRVLLSRDRELLMHRVVGAGCLIRSTRPQEQLQQVAGRFRLRDAMRPFSRCLECNGALRAVDRAAVAQRVPPAVAAAHRVFTRCDGCGRVYWQGSHWARLAARVDALVALLGARPDG